MTSFKSHAGTDYHQHQGLWLPDDLQTGDIIRCHMHTKYDGLEKAELCPRHVMVLGMEMDPETLEYTSIHVARFSYSKSYVTDDSNFLIPRSLERQGLITGLTDRAVLKADRTDFLPLTQDHFWGDVIDVQRIGRVDARLFPEIRATMERGQRLSGNSSRYNPRNPALWYVPGAHVAAENIPAPEHKHPFTPLNDLDLARIQTDWALRKDPQKLDAAYVTKCLASLDRAQAALARKENWEARQRHKVHVHDLRTAKPVFKITAEGAPASVTPLTADTPVSASPQDPTEKFTLLLPHAHAQSLHDLRALVSRFNDKAEESHSRIEIPAHLWQGRYMMCKIHDLHDEENDGTAYRPCAVWKAYKDRNTGELAGLELHPVTRGSLNTFRYRFQVYPLKTASSRPGHLIADCVIRVPLTSRYFHEKNTTNFFELPPDKLEKFRERREHALSSGDPLHVYGLKDIPEDWEEVALDPTPSYQQFVKWSQNDKIKFDGAVNDKPRQRQREARPF